MLGELSKTASIYDSKVTFNYVNMDNKSLFNSLLDDLEIAHFENEMKLVYRVLVRSQTVREFVFSWNYKIVQHSLRQRNQG